VRVLVVSQYFWPESFRINEIVSDLVRRGHEVTVLTGVPNYPEGVVHPAFREQPSRFARYDGADIVRVPLLSRGKGNFRLALNYASFALSGAVLGPWRLRRRQFDVIFIFQVSPVTAAIPGLLLARLRRIPVMMWVLDLWPESLAAVGAVRSERVLALVGALVRRIYRGCDLILGQSRSFARSIAQRLGDASRFRYFPAWSEALFQKDLADVVPAPEVVPYMDGTFNVLFAGNLGEAQDFPSILDAAERLRDRADLRWLIVGDGRAADWLRAEIRRRGLSDRVQMLGRYPMDRMPSFFRAADALLVSLKAEPAFAMTIPGKVQSYLATGLPVVGMLDGEGARVISESGAGVVCASGDGAGLAAAVVKLAQLPGTEREALGARGRAYAAREFDRDTLISCLEQWMRELVAANAGQAR